MSARVVGVWPGGPDPARSSARERGAAARSATESSPEMGDRHQSPERLTADARDPSRRLHRMARVHVADSATRYRRTTAPRARYRPDNSTARATNANANAPPDWVDGALAAKCEPMPSASRWVVPTFYVLAVLLLDPAEHHPAAEADRHVGDLLTRSRRFVGTRRDSGRRPEAMGSVANAGRSHRWARCAPFLCGCRRSRGRPSRGQVVL
jgi:hypothetical protein